MTVARKPSTLQGSPLPRVGADLPRGDIADVLKEARKLNLSLMPHQEFGLSVMEARDANGFLFREVADVEARQNGKSSKLAPLIRRRLLAGRRILHTAQNRIVPRREFVRVAGSFRKGEARIRFANGQEEISLSNGGSYMIIAPQRGIRGHSADDLIVDEVREFEDFDFMQAAAPTLTASPDPQIIYLSNAGHEASIVLNDLKARAGKDPVLAYMEWSAPSELDPGDVDGWAMANPALGRTIDLSRLEQYFNSYRESGNLAGWETEHLCRWVLSMAPRLVQDVHWQKARGALTDPVRPSMGVSVDPQGKRASAALSWAQGDGSIGLMVLADVRGEPLDVEAFAVDLKQSALEAGVLEVAFDPWTDAHLARHFPVTKPIQGQLFANATERFVRDVETGRVRWQWADEISADLPYAARKSVGGTSFVADRADPRRPITAALAAIRAVWLAAEPDQGAPSVY